MAVKNNAVSEKLLDTMDYIVSRQTKDLRNNFVRAAVTGVSSDGSFIVSINGAEYKVKSGTGMTYTVGDQVMVHIPNQDYAEAYIIASPGVNAKFDIDPSELDLTAYVKRTDLNSLTYLKDRWPIATKAEIDSLFNS